MSHKDEKGAKVLLKAALAGFRVMFASKKARKALPSGMAMAMEAMEGACADGARKSLTTALFMSATEEQRAEAAGFLNLLEAVTQGVRGVLTDVGDKLGDEHVQKVGCGNPLCANCNGGEIPNLDGLKKKVAEALGMDPSKVDVVAANSLSDALKQVGGVNEGEALFRVDPHTKSIADELEQMKGRFNLPKRDIPES